MAQDAQITCINKSNRYDPHERITHVGGYVTSHWKLTQQQAIELIENGTWRFYVKVGSTFVWVVVSVSQYGHKYLKTENDGQMPNNLLSLPECP